MRRAWAEIGNADRILLLVDDRQGLTAEDQALRERLPVATGVTVIHNKIDLTGREPGVEAVAGGHALWLSAKTGAGLDLLREHLKSCMGYHSGDGGVFMARRRHLEALSRADSALAAADDQLAIRAGELAAEELREAQNALAEITGEFGSEDLLERIFSSFCIGK